ncbi:hypothetical protein TH53_06850 [Pedobacter lusitanus]|uniref:NodB homology domain-containing protein n=1 Tax=Pedobacter lusitanus TaxID=1503925 RepID=A0A0D0GP13_9SPHI|nr:polysaccharide deacetylase family protein [Pedobacter lusitanus]KIO77850.1 hypothetical protein TH53_06850 [Pedobacter lusitanus]
MEVYLTFDDGIQSGTEEVLKVLKANTVNATFFLTGLFTGYEFKRDWKKSAQVLKDIYLYHAIGNHSFSHANEYYTSYYKDGLLINNEGKRRTVTEDFLLNKHQLNNYLASICTPTTINHDFLLAANQQTQLARLPGRNVWRCGIKSSHTTNCNRPICSTDESDTKQGADELFNTGYQIFGWHKEWHMQFDFSSETRRYQQQRIATGQMDYSSSLHTNPDWDMYSPEHNEKDRLTEDFLTVADKILEMKNEGKVILLMHDRAFRKSPDNKFKNEAQKLSKLIHQLKAHKVTFKTLDHYYKTKQTVSIL